MTRPRPEHDPDTFPVRVVEDEPRVNPNLRRAPRDARIEFRRDGDERLPIERPPREPRPHRD